ncbi:hypothetical protein P3X46_004455 [Hevea brasiliensis]|uniref:DUF4283 domain-containing protein n=1 Tax=Hevea brasiliensis TaxID=3981 RepID=A0ABQ9MZF5_HEVBR|nr:hypothetical protein P3X46_004455 [Hevea brasiliensis]
MKNTLAVIWRLVKGDIPNGFMIDRHGKVVGNQIGRFVESDANNFKGIWRNYMRISVAIDVHSPLKRTMKITKSDSCGKWINIMYQWLPTFCFYYEVIGHADKFVKNFLIHLQIKESRPMVLGYEQLTRNRIKQGRDGCVQHH